MRKRDLVLRRSLAVVLSTAMIVTALPADGLSRSARAKGVMTRTSRTNVAATTEPEANNPADCTNVAEDASDKIETLYVKEDGSASKNGLQNIKYVDENGKKVAEGEVINQEYASEGDALKYISDNVYFGEQVNEAGFEGTPTMTLPSSYKSPYDLREAVNQGSWGVCWSFGACAAMEANMVKQIKTNSNAFPGLTVNDIDLSERHLAWFTHNSFSTDKTDMAYGDGRKLNTPKKAFIGGGDHFLRTAVGTGSGPELEISAPYDTSSTMKGLPESYRKQAVARVKDINMLTYEKDNATVRKTVKAMIQNYGTATFSYNSSAGTLKEDSEGSYNYYTPQNTGSNHCIAVVGWDDNYPASEFATAPPADGAWLCRNSWGSGWADEGYVWVSYYDGSIRAMGVYDMQPVDTYGKAYYYASEHWAVGYNGGDKTLGSKATTVANVYQAKEAEKLNSVGVVVEGGGYKAEVTIYVSDNPMTAPTDGTKKAEKTVDDLGLAGFHTIDLDSDVSLAAGQYFSVIIRLINPNGTVWFQSEYKSAGKEIKGQTYYYDSYQDAWVDATAKNMDSHKNALIFAYTTATPDSTMLQARSELLSTAFALNESEITANLNGTTIWKRIATERTIASRVTQPNSMKRSIAMLEAALSMINSSKMYSDSTCLNGPGSKGIELFANGGSVKKNGITTNYKKRTMFVSFDRADSIVKQGKVYVYKVKGKYVAAVTTKKVMPSLNEDGTVKNPDTEAAKIATAKISGSKVIITPKSEGTVYVWVLWYPKSAFNQQDRLNAQTDCAMSKVTVGTAPTNVRLYAGDGANPLTADTEYKATPIAPGLSTDVYVQGTTGNIKKNTMKVIQSDDVGYTYSVAAKYAPYITVAKGSTNKQKFTISVASDIFEKLNVKDGKKLTVPVSIICDKNNKKATIKLLIGNLVQSMSVAAADDATKLTVDSGSKVATITLDSAATAAQKATFTETKTLYDTSGRKGTDGTQIVKLPSVDGYTYTTATTLKATGVLTAAQKKISLVAVKGKPGTYCVTAAKGTPSGTESYFVLFHNGYGRANGAGFQIVKVVVS